MPMGSLFFKPLASPKKTLLTIFIAWKTFLLLIALCSPGTGYDTSTTLAQPYEGAAQGAGVILLLRLLSTKLTRWDAIYYTKIASRGYLFEQEWAFGWGFTRLISIFSSDIGFHGYEFIESFVGIAIAHAAHGLSVLALYSLARAIFLDVRGMKLAFVAACLHIFSPAGLFLSAPYGESTFALLNFSGYLLFVRSFSANRRDTSLQDLSLAAAGLLLGAATTIRNNGLFNGLMFLEEACRTLYSMRRGIGIPAIRRLLASGIGGICIGVGFSVPQYIAFQEYCKIPIASDGTPLRIWCEKALPSIYAFVQDYYWNVGFLRYWTLSNVPLFLIASPMLAIMAISSSWAIELRSSAKSAISIVQDTRPQEVLENSTKSRRMLRSLAVPQLVLALLALTSYHVQIITRISSGYCVWYFWLANLLSQSYNEISTDLSKKVNRTTSLDRDWSVGIIRYIVIYAAIQGGLFSSFLPPA